MRRGLLFGLLSTLTEDETEMLGGEEDGRKTVVGLRMPYDLPLTPYGADEVPWCATLPQTEPDWMERVWGGY
jgi:tyrosyl-DNA phosphodiesterase-1